MSEFFGTLLVIVGLVFVGTALTVFCACVLAGRADDVIEGERRKEDL